MAKNQNAPKTVNTVNITNADDAKAKMEALRVQFAEFEALYGRDVLAAALPASLAKESVTLHSAQDAQEIASLKARNIEIDEEIERLTSALREERKANITRLSALNAAPTASERTRRVVTCPDCGQGRHAENEKTAACQIYPGYSRVVANAKSAKTAVPTFGDYLVSVGKASPAQV